MYYPWGDSAFRPFLATWARLDAARLRDGQRSSPRRRALDVSIGIGFKYPIYPWLIGRFEFTIILPSETQASPRSTDLTLAWGLEWQLWRHPKSYWPWYPSRHVW